MNSDGDRRRARAMARLRSKLPYLIRGFVLEPDDGARELVCVDVRGFRDALLAAEDVTAPVPERLGIVVPDAATAEWLARWSEDSERTHRSLTIRRLVDGAALHVVVTLASYGRGIETSLCVESVRAEGQMPDYLFRSGVHPRVQLDPLDRFAKRD